MGVKTVSRVSWFQDRLGWLVENYPGLFKWLGNLETKTVAYQIAEIPIHRPIYICGLARAGSTILLELLASHPDLATHKYKDFPFVHILAWWNRFIERARRPDTEAIERFHKDRIMVTSDSPEAMEEILWMAFFPDCHNISVNNVLGYEIINPAFERFYLDHIKKVIFLRGGSRYLAKGNYNIMRLKYIKKLLPDARFVIPVRDPMDQIASLIKQHALFCKDEKQDSRILFYMQRVGHFEFGLDRRPINFGRDDEIKLVERLWEEGEEVRGWAIYWSSVYSYLADLLETDYEVKKATCVVHYHDLCSASHETLKRLYADCDLPIDNRTLEELACVLSPPSYYSPPFSEEERNIIEDETQKTYERIKRFCRPD